MKSIRLTLPAFTVLEVLVALALIALLIGSVFSLIGELGRQRAQVGADWRAWRGTDAILDRLERDLACTIVGDAQLGAGVQGDKDHLTLLTRGVWLMEGAGAHIPAASRDLSRTEYRPADSGGVQYRETPIVRSASAPPERSGVLAESKTVLRFRYFDGREWLESFDSVQAGRLPLAVEVAIWLGSTPEPASGSDAQPIAPDRVRIIAIPDAQGAPTG